MSSLNPSLRLALSKKNKSKKTILEKGFTLIELMVVVAIVGVLSAVALPQFLGTKDKAEAGALIGSMVGLAKECATGQILESSELTASVVTAGGDITMTGTCNGSGNATFANTIAWTAGDVVGIACGRIAPGTDAADGTAGAKAIGTATSTTCTITVDSDGVVSGNWNA